MTTPHPSDSAEQRALETAILPTLGAQLGAELTPETIDLGDGVRVALDGISADRSVIVEVYGHVGELKGAQGTKLARDAFKLVFVGGRLGATTLVLAVVDQPAYRYLTGAKTWAAAALRDFGVTVTLIELDGDDHARILAVQQRQAAGMRGSGADGGSGGEPAGSTN